MKLKKYRSENTICVLSFSNKELHYTGLVRNFFTAPCKRVTFSLQKRKHNNSNTFK